MRPTDVDDVLQHAEDTLSHHGRSVEDIEPLRGNFALKQIVGKWPPDGTLPAAREDVIATINQLTKLQYTLIQTNEALPQTQPVSNLLDMATAHLAPHYKVNGAPDASSDHEVNIRLQGSGADNASIVGPWPSE